MKNLELKAVAANLPRLRRVLHELGARQAPQPLHQVDWYFTTPHGRLKLRQRKGEPTAELIFYVRADSARARTSEYQKLPVADARGMLGLLRAMFEPGACVRKRRELWLLGDTRIHLDRVATLGTFVEIEVPFTGDATGARRAMRVLKNRLGIRPRDVLARSYADLLDEGTARSE